MRCRLDAAPQAGPSLVYPCAPTIVAVAPDGPGRVTVVQQQAGALPS